tara:strand:+ start:33 stop:548 length:516 start_codon:yes stop_codon:yes gene_type:complete
MFRFIIFINTITLLTTTFFAQQGSCVDLSGNKEVNFCQELVAKQGKTFVLNGTSVYTEDQKALAELVAGAGYYNRPCATLKRWTLCAAHFPKCSNKNTIAKPCKSLCKKLAECLQMGGMEKSKEQYDEICDMQGIYSDDENFCSSASRIALGVFTIALVSIAAFYMQLNAQ